jgi:hypothetical protein
MKLEQDSLQKIKNYTHAVQGVLIFLAWVLTIAVFTREGSSDGRTGWYFGLVRRANGADLAARPLTASSVFSPSRS